MALSKQQKQLIASFLPNAVLKQGYFFKKPRAILLDTLEFIYIPIPKVANRSIKTVLQQKIGLPPTISSHKADWKYISLSKIATHPYYSFGFVRNPLDRLVSCYVQKIQMKNANELFWKYGKKIHPKMSFEAFASFVCSTPDHLSDRHFKSQHCFVSVNGKVIVDFIGKFEQLEADWSRLDKQYDLGSLAHFNQSKRKELSNYYTKDLAQKVRKRYTKDIELFGYNDEVDSFIESLA